MSEDRHLHLASLNVNQEKLDKTLKDTIRKVKGLSKETVAEVKFNYNQKHQYEKPADNVIVDGLESIDNQLNDIRWELQNLLNSTRFNGKPVVDVVKALEAETTNPKDKSTIIKLTPQSVNNYKVVKLSGFTS
mgnify:CR=1 FL=1